MNLCQCDIFLLVCQCLVMKTVAKWSDGLIHSFERAFAKENASRHGQRWVLLSHVPAFLLMKFDTNPFEEMSENVQERNDT